MLRRNDNNRFLMTCPCLIQRWLRTNVWMMSKGENNNKIVTWKWENEKNETRWKMMRDDNNEYAFMNELKLRVLAMCD